MNDELELGGLDTTMQNVENLDGFQVEGEVEGMDQSLTACSAQEALLTEVQAEKIDRLIKSGRVGLSQSMGQVQVDGVDWVGQRKVHGIKLGVENASQIVALKVLSHSFRATADVGLALQLDAGLGNSSIIDFAVLNKPEQIGDACQAAGLCWVMDVEDASSLALSVRIKDQLSVIKTQLKSLHAMGRLSKVMAISILVFDRASLASDSVDINNYFNAINGQENIEGMNALCSELGLKISEHGMAACCWLIDAQDMEGVQSQLDDDATAMVVGHAGAWDLSGYPGRPSSGLAVDLRVAASELIKLPFDNPMPGSSGQNSRDLSAEASEPTALSRLQEAIDMAKERDGEDSSEDIKYQSSQTGANSRRIAASKSMTKWTLVERKSPSKRKTQGHDDLVVTVQRLAWASCDLAIVDGQSSSAAFGCLAMAASENPMTFKAFIDSLRKHGMRMGLDFSSLAAKELDALSGARDSEASEQERMRKICEFLMDGEFPVILEFPANQSQAQQVARKANLATPQSTVDMIGAQMRAEMRQTLNVHANGRRNACKQGVKVQAPLRDVKTACHEPDDAIQLRELASIGYIGTAAAPAAFGSNGPSESMLDKIEDKMGPNWKAKALTDEGLAAKAYATWEKPAVTSLWSAIQSLSRGTFEAASHKSEMVKTTNQCLGDTASSCDIVDHLNQTAMDSFKLSPAEIAQAVQAQIVAMRQRTGKRSFKASLDVKKTLLAEMARWESSLARMAKKCNSQQMLEAVDELCAQSLEALAKHETGAVALEMSSLIDCCRKQAQTIKASHHGACSIPVDSMTKVVLASVLFTHEDSPLGKASLKQTMSICAQRSIEAAQSIGEKLDELMHVNGGVAISMTDIKCLSRLSADASSSAGQGTFGKALPKAWASEGLDPWPSASIWFLHAGIKVDGSYQKHDGAGRNRKAVHLPLAQA